MCHLYSFLYHTKYNIFFAFPDDAMDQKKLELKRKTVTVAQGLNRITY